jgi:hypothetical protein
MKYLSGIKPTLIGDRGRDVALSTSLTHVKYNHVGDTTSENLVAFNSFAPGAIAMAGGVFTGPITLKTHAAKLVTATSESGVVTINLAFGNFFKLVLTENVTAFDVINVPPQAAMFTLIVEQNTDIAKTIDWTFSSSTIKWGSINPATITATRTNLDIFAFKTTSSGSVWYASVNGLNYAGVGTDNPIDGTFLYTEELFIDIAGTQYSNGTKDILADGAGGVRDGDINYPPAYPANGAVTFKQIAHTDLYVQPLDQSYPNGNTVYVSDGDGGYIVAEEYPSSSTIFGNPIDYTEQHLGYTITLGSRNILADGVGGYTYGQVTYVNTGTVFNVNNFIVFRDDKWYQGTTGNATYNGSSDITYIGAGQVEYTYGYLSAGTVLASGVDWTIGYYLDTSDPINISADVVSDGEGKVYYVSSVLDYSVVATDYRTFPCGDLSNMFPCDESANNYQVRYLKDTSLPLPFTGAAFGYIVAQRKTAAMADWENITVGF